ncbi:MAG: FecR domain-containing protein [Balneolaceae bacterium]
MNWNLIHKYLSGECSSVERQKVIEWMNEEPRNKKLMASIKGIWEVTPHDAVEVNAEAAWRYFKKHYLTLEGQPTSEPREASHHLSLYHTRKRKSHIYFQWVLKSGAAAAVLLFSVFFYQFLPEPNAQQVPVLVDQHIETDRGQRTTVNLADGSKVMINAASKLTVPAGFPSKSRDVYLEGEAYFDVQSDKEKPFIVNSKHTFIKVLGTKFGVRAYPDEDHSRAVVEEGRVMVGYQKEKENQSEILEKNHLAVLFNEGGTEVRQIDNLAEYLGWKNGQLQFTDTPFRDVKRQLERFYAIQVEVEDTLMYDRRLTAAFSDEPLTEVLNVVSLSLNGIYSREGRSVFLKSK